MAQTLEKEMALGGELDSYEFEGPDRAEFLQDLAEFQLATVRPPASCASKRNFIVGNPRNTR